ncbi:hypothetical protein BH10PSE13_BH10PSE13_07520 [soil metagenome]
MNDMGLIGVIVIAVIAILLVVFLLRRKTGGTLPVEPTVAESPVAAPLVVPDIIPTVAPLPLVAPIPMLEPDSIAAPPPLEETPVPTDLFSALDKPGAPAPLAPAPDGDDLRRLKGVGPKIVTLLHTEGITRYAQIAAWTDADLAAINAKLGSFAGRPQRDSWVEQAQLLAAGDVAGYEAKFGKL